MVRLALLATLGAVILGLALAPMVVAQEGPDERRTFPLWAELAGDAELPLPFGLGLYAYHQSQDYELASLSLVPPIVDESDLTDVTVDNTIDEVNLKLDLWLLPFLNLAVIVGSVQGETLVTVGEPFAPLVVEYDGLVYGGGFTVAGGHGPYFASLSTMYTRIDPDRDQSSIVAWVITPKLGLTNRRGAVWVGAMYQEATEEHQGVITVAPYGEFAYAVELREEEPWNYLAGLEARLGRSWTLQLEGGVGKRTHALGALTYRF